MPGIGSPAILRARVSKTARAQSVAMGSALLAVLVLLGGIAPAVYGYGQPHDHFVLGGPPPVEGEAHEHVNPLTVLLGPIASPLSAADETTDRLPRSAPGHRPASVERVVSISSGAAPLLLTDIGIAVGPVLIDRFVAAGGFTFVAFDERRLIAQSVRGPRPPPPR